MNPLSKIRKYPVIWDTIKFGSLFTAAEITQQIIGRKIIDDDFNLRRTKDDREKIDWGSVFRFSVWGFAIFPHILRRWYRVLDSRITAGTPMRQAALKTAIDQAIFPVPILASFYVFLSALEGKTQSVDALTEECRVKLSTTLKARYAYMIPAQFINFALIKPHQRVFYVGVSTFFWLNILCVLKRLGLDNQLFS